MKKQLLKLFMFGTVTITGFTINAQTTRIVENTNDSGLESLRQTVFDANTGDTIRFNPSLIASGSDTITLVGEIAFSKSLVFKGLYNSTDTLYISGGNTNRHFNISNAGNVTLDSLVLVKGNLLNSSNSGASISIMLSDTLFVNNAILRNNIGASYGGGIYAASCKLIIFNSTICNNKANSNGGGVFFQTFSPDNVLLIENSTINGNESNNGGGISVNDVNSALTLIKNSTITNNKANLGGGINLYGYNSSLKLRIENSTISHNTATTNGGAIYSATYGSVAMIIDFKESIIWSDLNNPTNISGNGLSPTVTSNGYNIFSDTPPSGPVASDLLNVTETDLNLLPLAFNGGNTQTMAPGIGSVAINGGVGASDAQNRPAVGIRDVGAAEYNCSTVISEIETACPTFTWRDGKTYTTAQNGIEYREFKYGVGVCDEVYVLDLTVGVDITTTHTGITLSANATGATYQWLDCNNNFAPISGATSKNFTATVNGNYAVIVTKNGCSDTSACMSVSTVGLSKNNLVIEPVEIYPNPVNDELTIVSQGQINQISVYDVKGKLLQTTTLNSASTIKIDFSTYELGVYLINIHTAAGQVSTSRVVKK